MSGRKVNTHICNFSTFWNHFMQILESAWTLHFKLLASFKLQMSKIFPLGGLLQLEVTKALKTNYHSTSTTTFCSITWHLIAEPEYHCNQFCMLIHCSAGIGNVVHLIWLSGGFSWYFLFLPNQNLHSFQSCNTVQIDWELGLREGLGNYKTFLFSYCNLCSLPPLWNYIEVTHCMSRSSLEAFSKEIWKSFMNTLIPIKNLISSVLILCTFSNFCIKIIMFTYLQLMNKGKFDNS